MASVLKELLLTIAFVASVTYVVSSTCPHAKFDTIPGHSACKDPSPNLVAAGSTLTEEQETELVTLHNNKRAEVAQNGAGGASGATDMLKMKWDDELAMIAQKWANTCDDGHDSNDMRLIPGRFKVGQNIFQSESKDPMADVVLDWYNEKEDFTYDTYTSATVGHFTQLVWSQSNLLGCGISQCSGRADEWAVVCNYGVVGNMHGEGQSKFRPFKTGTMCTDCPAGKCDSATGLCDLGGKECHSGGTLDIPTESCNCPANVAWVSQTNCDVDCNVPLGEDWDVCTTWVPAGYCESMTNVKYEYCPKSCQLCPGADFNNFIKRAIPESEKQKKNVDNLIAKLLMRILA